MSAYFTNGVNVTQIHPTAEVFTYFSSLLIFGSLVASGLWLVFKWRGHVPKSFPMYLWLFLCGIIHVVIEGHLFRSSPLDRSMISSLWAEYSKGDIRYFTDDPVTFIIELMTYVCIQTGLYIPASVLPPSTNVRASNSGDFLKTLYTLLSTWYPSCASRPLSSV